MREKYFIVDKTTGMVQVLKLNLGSMIKMIFHDVIHGSRYSTMRDRPSYVNDHDRVRWREGIE